MARTIRRWIPAGVAVVAVAAAAVGVPLAANASSALPEKSAAQVVALVAGSKVTALSGTIEQSSDLGLPSLPTTGGGSGGSSDSSAASTLELLTGSHTAQVFVDGKSKERIQVLDQMAERDVIRNGTNLWIYDSKSHTAQHATIPAKAAGVPEGKAPVTTPKALATKLLAALQSSSTVTVGADISVAHRTAYNLVIRPNVTDTLIGSITIAVDPQTGVPLRVNVNARGQSTPAVSVAFSDVHFTAPDASVFAFTPSKGTTVKQLSPKKHPGTSTAMPRHSRPAQDPASKPVVTGKGWDAVVTIPKQAKAAGAQAKLTSSPLFTELTTAVAGGRVFHTSLVNVLLTDDGRIIAGSVSVARLQAVAAAP